MILSLSQVDPRTVEALERIATMQTIIAIMTVVNGIVIAATIAFALAQRRALRRGIQELLAEWKPAVAPLLDRAKSVTDDVAGITDNVRRKVDDALHTLEELRRAAEKGGAATEERVRRFGQVLDVVQAETEELLLDAAATARGVHETARALRSPRQPVRRASEQEEAG